MKNLFATCLIASSLVSAGPLVSPTAPVDLPYNPDQTSIESSTLSLGSQAAAPAPTQTIVPLNRASLIPTSVIPVDTPEPGTLSAMGLAIGCLAWKLRRRSSPQM